MEVKGRHIPPMPVNVRIHVHANPNLEKKKKEKKKRTVDSLWGASEFQSLVGRDKDQGVQELQGCSSILKATSSGLTLDSPRGDVQ